MQKKPLALSPNELKKFLFLMCGERKALSRDELINHIRGYNEDVKTEIYDENKKAVRTVPGHSADSLKKRIKRRHYYIKSAGCFFSFHSSLF